MRWKHSFGDRADMIPYNTEHHTRSIQLRKLSNKDSNDKHRQNTTPVAAVQILCCSGKYLQKQQQQAAADKGRRTWDCVSDFSWAPATAVTTNRLMLTCLRLKVDRLHRQTAAPLRLLQLLLSNMPLCTMYESAALILPYFACCSRTSIPLLVSLKAFLRAIEQFRRPVSSALLRRRQGKG